MEWNCKSTEESEENLQIGENYTLLTQKYIKKEITENLKNTLRWMKTKIQNTKSYEMKISSA